MTYAETVAVSFGAAHVAVLALSGANRRNVHALGCAAMLLLIWIASMAMERLYDPPVSWVLSPALDFVGTAVAAIVFFGGWRRPLRRAWAFGLMLVFLAQGYLGVLFWTAHNGAAGAIHNHARLVDILLAVGLLFVALPGVGHVAQNVLRRWGVLRGVDSVHSRSTLAG